IFSRHRPTVIAFTSSSTVENLLRLLPSGERERWLADVKTASIGPITSQTLRKHGLPVHIEASEYTIPSLVAAIVNGVGNTGGRL
ncbi:MAG: uroporphyrinogen-III synthase, partial [Acidobacteria bacterium]|nr:uroporphyrinogen-III synthase [Acidobacteriota bacterium]